MSESALRDEIVLHAKSLYDRGLAHGSTGNISARTEDGGFLVTPTGSSMGFLDPTRLTKLDSSGRFVSGDKPTKELPLHAAFYETRGTRAGAVVHLHSHHAVALSTLADIDSDHVLPPLTPYPIMQFGAVKLLPYMRPGDPALGEAVSALDGRHAAVLLANHGPAVAMDKLSSAVWAMEELEAAARLTLEVRGREAIVLSDVQIAELVAIFGSKNDVRH